MDNLKILIAGGGTGGHLFPALAIGEEINFRNPDAKIHYVGSNFGLGNSVLSISDYNDINGSNFDNPTASKYFPKADVLSLFNNGIGFNSQMAIALPFSSITYNNISFSSRNYFCIDATLPSKSFIKN